MSGGSGNSSVSVSGSNVTGATANLSTSDDHSVDLHLAAPVAALLGVEVESFDVFNLDVRVLGAGAAITIAYDPGENSISFTGSGGVVLNGEGSLSFNLDDLEADLDGDLFFTIETGGGVSALGFGAGAGLNATIDNGQLVVGGNLDVFHLGFTGEATLLRPDPTLSPSEATFVADLTRQALIGNSGDLETLEATIAMLVQEYPDIVTHPEFLSRVAPSIQALGGQEAWGWFLNEHLDGGCFLAGTEISMWDGTKKTIEEITPEDEVVSYDKGGNLVPGKVTRVFQHQAEHILDVHGLMVTPSHVTFCGDGRFDGQHVPIIDILRSDGALVKEDGTKVRAGTNEVVGSPRDQLIHVISGERDADGKFTPRQRGTIRLGTKFIFEDEKGDSYVACIADIIEQAGGIVRSDGMIVREPGGEGMPYLWPNGPLLPHPEDYVLQRSKLTLNDIYAAGEWEAVQPQMPPPPSAEALPVKGPEGLMAKPANASGAKPRQAMLLGKPMTRQQRRAAQARERKATKTRKRMALS